MTVFSPTASRPNRRKLVRAVVATTLAAGLVPALLPATADAAPLDLHPTRPARLSGVTASGGGYAGWALGQRPTTRAAATATTPSGVPGIDVASYQGNVNWSDWYAKGVRWTYIKATEGTSYTNPSFSQQYTGSYNAKMTHGAYHFARPDSGTGAAQARYFVAHGGGWSADGRTLPGALDIEDNYSGARCYGNTAAQNVAWVQSFLTTYKSLTGRDAVIYTNIPFWKDCLGNTTAFSATNPFWLAYWSSSRPSSYPGGWTYDTFWQYSGSGTDQDVFNGTAARLKVLATGSDPAAAANADPDGDGLTNAQEATYGTDPNKKDTDGDGFSDKAEITGLTIPGHGTVRTNPLAKDTDGDGLSDYTEIRTGFRVWTPKQYTTYASPILTDTDHDGLSDAKERSLHLSPRRKDTDRDGLGDKTEVSSPITVRVKGKAAYKVYSSPLRKSADRDGLSDPTERQLGTDPTKKDTDRDGVRDSKDHRPLNPKKH